MSTQQLPDSIGGYQHLQPDVASREDDIYVLDGSPVSFVGQMLAGYPVGQLESIDYRVYRKYACPSQGGERAPEMAGGGAGGASLAPTESVPPKAATHDDGKPPESISRGAANCPLPSDAKTRKGIPIYSGFLRYFPRAVAAMAELSRIGNDQHNPGKPLHWDRSKSGDEHDALMRHLLEAGKLDSDGVRHSTKAAWRACAALEKELEAEAAEHGAEMLRQILEPARNIPK